MKETKYTKEDWINGKVALEWEHDKAEKIGKFFKECNSSNGYGSGNYKYYFCNSCIKGYFSVSDTTNLSIVKIDDIVMEEKEQFPKDDFGVIVENNNAEEIVNYLVSKGFSNYFYFIGDVDNNKFYYIDNNDNIIRCTSSNPTSKTYTLEQLKQLDNNNTETKKIIGYLVKKEYAVHAKTLIEKVKGLIFDTMQNGVEAGCNFTLNSGQYSFFKEAGVLDIWFTPVFEPEKPKEKDITLSNNKSVKIKKEGLYVEDRLIFIYDIESLFKTSKFANTEWIFQINNFDIGCYKNLNRKDLENILKTYKSLN